MAYIPTQWQNNAVTPVNAENLNHQEAGIILADTNATNARTRQDVVEAQLAIENAREVIRIASEITRVANEVTRVANEPIRISAETLRTTAETKRETDYNTYKNVMIDASNVANLQNQINGNVAQLAANASQLLTKAPQSALDSTNTRVTNTENNKVEKSDANITNNNVTATNSRIDSLVLNTGSANVEVTDAHVSTINNKTYPTLRPRIEENEQNILTTKTDVNDLTISSNDSTKFEQGIAVYTSAVNWIASKTVSTTRVRCIDAIKFVKGSSYKFSIDVLSKYLVLIFYADGTKQTIGWTSNVTSFTPVQNGEYGVAVALNTDVAITTSNINNFRFNVYINKINTANLAIVDLQTNVLTLNTSLINTLSSSDDVSKFESGSQSITGTTYALGKSPMTTRVRIIDAVKIYKGYTYSLSVGVGYKYTTPTYYADGTKFSTAWFTTPISFLATQDGEMGILLAYADDRVLTAIEVINFKFIMTCLKMDNIMKDIQLLKTDVFLNKNRKHSLEFEKADIISNWKLEKMSHTSCLCSDTDGIMYSAYMGNNIDANESPNNVNIQINLVKFNVCDTRDIERWEAIKVNQVLGGFTQGSKPPYDPNLIITATKVMLLFSAYDNASAGTGNASFLGCRVFDKISKTFDNIFSPCQLKYTINTTDTIVRFDTKGIQQCYRALGYTLSTDLTDVTVMFTSQIILNGGYYYASFGVYGTDFRGMVVRSLDGITWEIYAIPNQALGGNVMENCIEIVGTKLYYITRTGYFCVYDMTSRLWLSYQALMDCTQSKVNVFYYNSNLYIAYNKIVTFTTDWESVPRNTMIIKQVDMTDTTKMTDVLEVQLDGGICYYSFTRFKGSLYMTFTNDRRKLNAGQINSNISFIPVIL